MIKIFQNFAAIFRPVLVCSQNFLVDFCILIIKIIICQTLERLFFIPPLYKHICTCLVIDEDPFEKLVKEKWLGIRAEYQDHLMCDTEDGQSQHLAEAKKLFMNLLEESLKRYENDPLNTEKGQLISKEIFGDMSFCQKNIILPKKYHFAKKISMFSEKFYEYEIFEYNSSFEEVTPTKISF